MTSLSLNDGVVADVPKLLIASMEPLVALYIRVDCLMDAAIGPLIISCITLEFPKPQEQFFCMLEKLQPQGTAR